MKVRELIELLSQFDQEEEVVADASSVTTLSQQDIAFLDITDVALDEVGNISLQVE